MSESGPDRGEPPPEPAAADGGPPAGDPRPEPAVDDATQAMATPFTAPIDTDAAVDTETVETPPVKIFVPEPPTGRRRVRGRTSALLAVLGILAIGGVAAFGYTLNQDLTATRASLAGTQGDLDSTKTTLEATTGTLETTTTTLNTAKAERTKLDADVADLSAQVSSQTKCVQLQRAALAELYRISDLQTVNNNRTAEGSTWAKAADKRSNAVDDALEAYYQAAKKAADGNKSSARAWADKGKAAVAIIAAQAKQELAEFGLIDRSAAEIETAIDALEKQLVTTEVTCKEVD